MANMKYWLLIIGFVVGSAHAYAQSENGFSFKTGDLIFQDLDCGGLCDAIEAVTPVLGNKHFSHIGLVYNRHDTTYIIEAIGKDVHLTLLDSFIFRQINTSGQPQIVVGRLKKQYQLLNAKAIKFALKQIGKPYDDEFIYNNGKYYCSELIYDAYKAANKNHPLFTLSPMTFKDPTTNTTNTVWADYYQKLGKEIPEGKLGCNPGSIATSDKIDIVAYFF